MEKRELLYEGKAKKLFTTMDKDRFRQELGGLKVANEQVLERNLGSNKQ